MITRLIKFAYLILFFLTPLVFSPTSSELFEFPKILLVYSLTTIIVCLHLINVFSGNAKLFKSSPLTIPLIIFFVSQILATIFSIDQHTSLFGYYSRFNGGLLSTISYLSLYFIFIIYHDHKFINACLNTSLFAGLLVALFGIAEHFGIDKNYWVQDVQARVFSTLGQPNWLAAYLCLLLPFSVSKMLMYFDSKKFLLSAFSFSLSTLFFICLLFTKSKTGLVAAAASLGIFFIVFTLKNMHQKASLFLLTFTFGLLAILSITISNPIKDIIIKPQPTPATVATNTTINITASEDIRKLVWQGAFDLWKKFPYFGTGVETFAYSYYWTRPVAHNLTSEWDFLYNKAHNEYLNYVATTGTFGLATYLLIICIVILSLAKNLTKKDYLLPLALLTSFTTLLITNATGFSVIITSVYFFLIPGFLHPTSTPSISKPINRPALILITLVGIFILSKILNIFRADLAYNIATSYNDQGYYSDAQSTIKQAIDLFPDEPTYLIKQTDIITKNALIALQQEDTQKARALAETAAAASTKALNISPANINFYKEQAQDYYYLSLIDQSYFPKAINALLNATKLAPTDAKSFYILGKFWASVDKYDRSLLAYQQALDLKPNYDYASFALGQIYFDQKEYQKAKSYFETTLKISPNNADAKQYLQKITDLKI